MINKFTSRASELEKTLEEYWTDEQIIADPYGYIDYFKRLSKSIDKDFSDKEKTRRLISKINSEISQIDEIKEKYELGRNK